MSDFYTLTGPRPDLAAIEVNAPESYIGHKLIPIVPVMQKSGTVYYATKKTDGDAETDRAAGAAPTASAISNSSTTFTCAEKIKRGTVTPDEAKGMGGIDKADEVGAKYAKRSVMNSMEVDAATQVLAGGSDATYNFDPAKVLTQTQDALQALRQYEGLTTLVAATRTLKGMVQALLGDATQGKVLSRVVQGTSPIQAAAGLNMDAWTAALAMYLGVDQVMAGDDAIWNATAVSGRFSIGKFDDGVDELSHKWKPVFAKNWLFLPDDAANPYFLESIGDRLTKNNMYDASVWNDIVVLNTGARIVFDGV